ncbi:MAG: (2Fe-2S)-binding protein [Candidatus Krumholzibacteriota bacterium]|nr:(2Fe-2S)-binding protein [Candidatus Krumholzibacteriota bacterium]
MHHLDLSLTVNGRPVRRRVATTLRLLDFLREELDLTGAKEVCAEGECGACTVLLDGRPVNSCLVLAVECEGAEVVTIEGIDHPVQDALMRTHAVQCGYCFPGMVISAAALLAEEPGLDRQAVREGLAGNICRCTGYAKILDAVELAARRASAHRISGDAGAGGGDDAEAGP